MLFAVHFKDDPEKRHLRAELMAAHLAFLQKHSAAIRMAGSMRKEADDSPIGGLWIVDATSFQEVRSMVAEDPFWTAGLRASVEMHRLAKAFPEKEVSV